MFVRANLSQNTVLKSFVVHCKEDFDTLYRGIRSEQGIPVNIVTCAFDPVGEMKDHSAFIVKTLWAQVNFGHDDQSCFDIQDLLVHFEGEDGENIEDAVEAAASAGLSTTSDDENDTVQASIHLGLKKHN